MGISFEKRFLVVCILLAFAHCAVTASIEGVPEVTKIVRSGKETLEKLPRVPAAWTARYRLPNDAILEIDIIRDGARQSWKFIQFIDGRPVRLCDIIQSEGVWHVLEKGYTLKCRPYEAELHFPGAYFFLSLAELRCVADPSHVAAAIFEARRGTQLSYRVPVQGEIRRMLEQVVSEYEKMASQNLASGDGTELAQTVSQAREQLAKGTLMVIDEMT